MYEGVFKVVGLRGPGMVDDKDTSRTAVRTYVPAYQKSIWKEHAQELEMSQSEFVRTMVQAGRRNFEVPSVSEADESTHDTAGGAVSIDTSSSTTLDEHVLDILDKDGHLSWDELRESLIGDFEDQLENALSRLQDSNRVRYSGRHGGYTAVENHE